jgi:hypothetical protein
MLGVGPQGLGGDSTAFAVHVETAATHHHESGGGEYAVPLGAPGARHLPSRRGGIWLLGFCSCSIAFSSFGAEVAGVKIPDTDQQLVLNGAGLRKRAFFDVYAIGLYLPEKKATAADAIGAAGAKRVAIHMLRDVGVDQFSGALIDGMKDNVGDVEMKALEPRIKQLLSAMNTMQEAKKGMRITLDWMPAAGTQLTVEGKPAGTPSPARISTARC